MHAAFQTVAFETADLSRCTRSEDKKGFREFGTSKGTDIRIYIYIYIERERGGESRVKEFKEGPLINTT